ncbi:MAG: prepilin peptidase [Candidatus Portnoybacteria bacterium]|nr:prepilin peptidase [Candidatus Portnoybacteria bacterium]
MIVLFFVLGLVIGSFLNVIIIRLKKEESWLKRRSYCPWCKKGLSWYELIPLVSFFIQKGKCRGCKKKISWQYPLVEFFTGVVFVLIGLYFFEFSVLGFINALFLFIISSLLIVIFVYDLKHYIVPDQIIYPAIVFVFLYKITFLFLINNLLFILYYFLAAVVGGAFFLAIVLISRGKWMGWGDVKIGFLMGLLLGFSGLIVALFLSFLSGALISVILLSLKKKGLRSEIPLAPFLVFSALAVLFWESLLIRWYTNLFI